MISQNKREKLTQDVCDAEILTARTLPIAEALIVVLRRILLYEPPGHNPRTQLRNQKYSAMTLCRRNVHRQNNMNLIKPPAENAQSIDCREILTLNNKSTKFN